jgi:hypothetical protein
MPHEVKTYPVIGETIGPGGKRIRVKWNDVEILHLDGRHIATINKIPGAGIGLLGGIVLAPAEQQAVEEFLARTRGEKPAFIREQVKLPYEVLDDAEGAETDTEDE